MCDSAILIGLWAAFIYKINDHDASFIYTYYITDFLRISGELAIFFCPAVGWFPFIFFFIYV
jgi:hypothetical protein